MGMTMWIGWDMLSSLQDAANTAGFSARLNFIVHRSGPQVDGCPSALQVTNCPFFKI